MNAKQPIAIVRCYLPSGWERIYECSGPAEIAYVVRWLRECDRRFYIEWLDTNHGDGRDD